MSNIDYKELFAQYYQNEYDFNTVSLSQESLEEIRQMVREKRVDYALAPMGTGVFAWIQKHDRDIRYELIAFDSAKIDGMLYIPRVGEKSAYIVLNSNKPLINQIFTAAHEYYHYIKDYQKIKEVSYVCDLSRLEDVNEKCACRFAAELLLPREALQQEIEDYLLDRRIDRTESMTFEQYATLIIFLTVKYQMPMKAVIYRFVEEHYIDSADRYIKNCDFMKKVLMEIKILQCQVSELYGTENKYIIPYKSIYSDMKTAFMTGNATREDILADAQKLGLDMSLIYEFLGTEIETEETEDENDDQLFQTIQSNWGEKYK